MVVILSGWLGLAQKKKWNWNLLQHVYHFRTWRLLYRVLVTWLSESALCPSSSWVYFEPLLSSFYSTLASPVLELWIFSSRAIEKQPVVKFFWKINKCIYPPVPGRTCDTRWKYDWINQTQKHSYPSKTMDSYPWIWLEPTRLYELSSKLQEGPTCCSSTNS